MSASVKKGVGVSISTCPHCAEPTHLPKDSWARFPPLNCGQCGKLFGIGATGKLFSIPEDFEPFRFLMTFEQARHWCFQARNMTYCYAVCYPNGVPLYVGKGRADRMIQHGHCIRPDLKHAGAPQDEKDLAIASIHWNRQEELYAVLFTGDEVDALQVEALTIRKLGIRIRGGMLTNADYGNRQRRSEIWCPPSQPAVKANGEYEHSRRWIIHPDFPKRIRSHKGLEIECPACKASCFHPSNVRLNGARCPECLHFIEVNGAKMNAYWLHNRPRVNAVARLRGPEEYAVKREDTSRIKRFWRS